MTYVHDEALNELEDALQNFRESKGPHPIGFDAAHRLHAACVACNMDPGHDDPAEWAAARCALRMLTGE